MKKRLRVFAGPNGSGKSTITDIVKSYCDLGVYVNADEIKKKLDLDKKIDFAEYKISIDEKAFLKAFSLSSIVKKSSNKDLIEAFYISENSLIIKEGKCVDGYFVSFIADYLRNELLLNGEKFSCETVMSHSSKIDFMKKAKDAGYKVYLYFVALRNPELNVLRVQNRVAEGGHDVPKEKIIKRYYESLEQLYVAMKVVDSAFIFDNSVGQHKMIAQLIDKKLTIMVDYYPKWFEDYYLNKITERNQSEL